jgi:hypothetical protein
MREERVRGGGGSSVWPGRLGLVALCFWLGLAAVQTAAGKPLHLKKIDPDHPAKDGIKNVQLTVTLTGAPPDLASQGNVTLRSVAGETLKTTYKANKGTVEATFATERKWEKVSYESVDFDPPWLDFQIDKPVDVDPVERKPLTVEPDLDSTTSDILAFRATPGQVPSGVGAATCKNRFYLVRHETADPVNFNLQAHLQKSRQGSVRDVSFKLDRSVGEGESLDAVLELCQGDDRWVYRSEPLEIVTWLDLEIRQEKRDGSRQALALEIADAPANADPSLDARYLDKVEILGVEKGSRISFSLQRDSYVATQEANCSSEEPRLPKLRLTAQDSKGRQYLFGSRGEEPICTKLPSDLKGWIQFIINGIRKVALPWLTGASVLLALMICAFVYRHEVRGWFRRNRKATSGSPDDPVPSRTSPVTGNDSFQGSFPEVWRINLAEILQSQLGPLRNVMQDVRDDLREVRNHQLEQPSAAEQDATAVSPRSLPMQSAGTLTDLVSRWWADGADRDQLDDLIRRNSSIKPYRSSNVQDSLRNTTNRTFLFQPSEGLAEWLGRMQQGDLFLVPGDPKLFQTGDSLKFLGVLFDGLGASLSNVRFRRVLKACRLKKEPGAADRYRVMERGLLELEGRLAAEAVSSPSVAPYHLPQPAPAVQPVLSEKELAEVVRRAVVAAVPVGLPDQIQDLSRQVRAALAESGSRQGAEPPRPDPNVSAVLGGVRQDLFTLGQRLNAIEGLARLVETLRESLVRIEADLRDLRHPQPLPAAPVAPAPEPALPEPAVDNLPADWDGHEVIPEDEYSPLPPLVSAFDRPESPEELWSSLQRWWPKGLVSGLPDGYLAAEPAAAYVWNLQETKRRLSKASGDRGWQVDVVHVKLPENTSASERSLQIHEPRSIGDRQVLCTCAPSSPFTDALLFQFALRVRGDHGRNIAVFPAPGLRLTGSIEGYARLAGGRLPEGVTSLSEVLRPAILTQSGTGDLYTVVLSMQGRFQ